MLIVQPHPEESGPSPGYYYWNPITTTQNLAKGAVFFFHIHDLSGSGKMFGSHYFNLTAGSATSSTSSIAKTSATAPATASATSSEATSSSKHSSSSSPGAMSSSTKAGIGIGVGIGGSLIAAIAVGFFLLRRRKTRSERNEKYSHGLKEMPEIQCHEMAGDQRYEMPAQDQRQELSGQGIRAELPATHVQ